MTTIQRLQPLLAAVLRIGSETVNPDSRIRNLVDLDSLHLVEIAAAVEEEFQVDIPSDAITSVMTVQDLATLVDSSPAK